MSIQYEFICMRIDHIHWGSVDHFLFFNWRTS
nr:MAG TPA: cytochrome oxidase subunit [Caudoviricetes sp.]